MAIIKIENLSKKYIIGHDKAATGSYKYKSLRDSLAHTARGIGQRLLHPLSPNTETTDIEEFWALKDINLEIEQGDKVGIIGRNGAGKSTLLKILSRITEPTSGKITMKGRVASLLEVGTGFHPELTGRENIYLNGAVLGMTRKEIKKKFDEIVDFAGVEKFLDTPVKRYSSGMYVRLAFAVAAHLDPEILLIDEVLAVGDAEFQKKCLGKMDEVSKQGRTILFVSHNMEAIKTLCSKSVHINSGLILKYGNTNDVIKSYLSKSDSSNGKVEWQIATAPGVNGIKLKSMEVITNGKTTPAPQVNQEIELKLTYWNFENEARRLVSFHLKNSLNQIIFTSANMKSTSTNYDFWVDKPYPRGIFSTSCIIPKDIFNPGQHSVDLYLNRTMANDSEIILKDIISFEVKDTSEWRTDYLGEWMGAVRPKLFWITKQLE
ncbi:MAG: polysaccharide ABC transporter ATP-binding protein [Lentisphaerota bacterium]